MMVADPEVADRVRLMFEMYADPGTSFVDITRYFAEEGISFDGKELQRATLSLAVCCTLLRDDLLNLVIKWLAHKELAVFYSWKNFRNVTLCASSKRSKIS